MLNISNLNGHLRTIFQDPDITPNSISVTFDILKAPIKFSIDQETFEFIVFSDEILLYCEIYKTWYDHKNMRNMIFFCDFYCLCLLRM